VIYLAAIFVAPLALLLCGKWFQAILNLVLYNVAIVLVVTMVFSWAGVIVWAVGVLHAVLVIHNHKAERRNQALIDAVKGQST
jgi:hypothetical protein